MARYVRMAVRAEDLGTDGSGITWQNEVRQMEDRLGLSPRSMHLLNYRVIDESGNEFAPISDLDATAKRSEMRTANETPGLG